MEVGYHTFPSGKEYLFVRQGKGAEKEPVFLRNIIFLRNTSDPREIAIVREWGAEGNKHVWEPPKGQMEWKELRESGIRKGSKITPEQLLPYMREGVLREMSEEAKVYPNEITGLRMLPMSYTEEWPSSGLSGAKFQYQFWTANLTQKHMLEAQARMRYLVEHPDLKEMLPADVCEKDAIAWWKPEDGWLKIRGAFSQKMTAAFYKELDKHGVRNS